MSDDRSDKPSEAPGTAAPGNFIRDIILADNASGKHDGQVRTRFPPEPNGYLHIGHAKAISIDFGMAEEFGGTTNLRYDDTNPTKEDVEYVEAIEEDIRWLGYQWANLHFASDYFEELYRIAETLIDKGVAYVDSLSEEEIREYRGNFYKKGRPSPYRDRPAEESLRIFREMRAGKYQDGEHVLRAKIDLETQNMNLRDPVLYRIRHAHHHRTGDAWCIYPMYDYAHPLSDAIERITHSICTLEFESHRPLYDWCIAQAGAYPSQQIEFARLNLTYTMMSKRKLLELVEKNVVEGWDDPRMPTLAGMRRRGYTPEAIRNLCTRTGVAKANSVVDLGLLEYCVREDLNRIAPRVMAVLRPLKVTITNFPEGEVREIDAPLHPEDPSVGSRKVPFARELWIEREDWKEVPVKGWHRLSPGAEVRLRYACLIKCNEVVKDASGEVVELKCTWDEGSWGGNAPDGRTVRGTLHWVAAPTARDAEVRLYDRLFNVEAPGTDEGRSFLEEVNPGSLEVVKGVKVEPYLGSAKPGDKVQFERLGYFCVDKASSGAPVVWNRTVTLKDSWAKIEKKVAAAPKAEGKKGKDPSPAPQASRPLPAGEGNHSLGSSEIAGNPTLVPMGPEITIDDFGKLDLRCGRVMSAELVPDAKKLLRLQVDVGEGRLRQIFAGIRAFYPDPAALVGKRVIVVANLKPRQMKWGLSEGMILAAGGGERAHRVATFDSDDSPLPGDKIA